MFFIHTDVLYPTWEALRFSLQGRTWNFTLWCPDLFGAQDHQMMKKPRFRIWMFHENLGIWFFNIYIYKYSLAPTWRRLIVLYRFVFSRMRSEGFPFIVGVWGWTCVRVVLLCRRRLLVVVSSSCRRRGVVNSLPLGGTFALRSNPYLQSVKSGGSLARNARFGASKSQNMRSFSCFA